jgi:hypothetical protein
MAKTKGKAQSFASIIRGYYQQNPDWLQGPSNQALIERYHKDHPGDPWSKKHQQGAANVKTKLRKEMGLVRKRRRRRRGAGAGASEGGANAAGQSRVTRMRPAFGALEQLELLIDDCLSLAHRQNNPALEKVVKHLRVARRGVAWAMGEESAARV